MPDTMPNPAPTHPQGPVAKPIMIPILVAAQLMSCPLYCPPSIASICSKLKLFVYMMKDFKLVIKKRLNLCFCYNLQEQFVRIILTPILNYWLYPLLVMYS